MTPDLTAVEVYEELPSRTTNSTRLLVSVRDARELEAAVAGGADWIDLKEPNAGSLAAVDACVALQVAAALSARLPLSAALGEMVDWPTSRAHELLEVEEIEVFKLGLAGCGSLSDWDQQWLQVLRTVRSIEKQFAAVIYADWRRANAPPPNVILQMALAHQCNYLLIDTYDKKSGSSLRAFSKCELMQLLQQAKEGALKTVLAGSISSDGLAEIPMELVDLLAVRGAACKGLRTSEIDCQRVRELRNELSKICTVDNEKNSICKADAVVG